MIFMYTTNSVVKIIKSIMPTESRAIFHILSNVFFSLFLTRAPLRLMKKWLIVMIAEYLNMNSSTSRVAVPIKLLAGYLNKSISRHILNARVRMKILVLCFFVITFVNPYCYIWKTNSVDIKQSVTKEDTVKKTKEVHSTKSDPPN